jgi:acetyltransferase-like isoleucine patch superfamily enzyme
VLKELVTGKITMKNYIKRLKYLPQGIFEGIISFSNNHARDVENRKRFSHAIIDKGSSFTEDIQIGKGTHILSNCVVNHSSIGKYTYISKNALIQNAIIGNYCSIAPNVSIGLGQHPIDLISTSPLFYRRRNPLNISLVSKDYLFEEYKQIIIESDVWIGKGAIIMDGVVLGIGSIVAAGAVVTKNVPPYAIVGGIPAKVIKYRFEKDKINRILQSEWWKLDPNEVKNLMF